MSRDTEVLIGYGVAAALFYYLFVHRTEAKRQGNIYREVFQ